MADQSPPNRNPLTPTASYDWTAPLVRRRISQLVQSAAVWAASDTARVDIDSTDADACELDALLGFAAAFGYAPNRYELEAIEASSTVPPIARAAVRWADSSEAFSNVCAAAAEPANQALCNLLISACLVARALRLEPPSSEPDDAQAFRHLAAVAVGKALCS